MIFTKLSNDMPPDSNDMPPDGGDMNWVLMNSLSPRARIIEKYPQIKVTSLSSDIGSDNDLELLATSYYLYLPLLCHKRIIFMNHS